VASLANLSRPILWFGKWKLVTKAILACIAVMPLCRQWVMIKNDLSIPVVSLQFGTCPHIWDVAEVPEFADNCGWGHAFPLYIMNNYAEFRPRLRYTHPMKNSLSATNPYLKNPAMRERALTRNIESSSAVEGIKVKRNADTGRFVTKQSSAKAATTIKKNAR
jgi:hypothetical protein